MKVHANTVVLAILLSGAANAAMPLTTINAFPASRSQQRALHIEQTDAPNPDNAVTTPAQLAQATFPATAHQRSVLRITASPLSRLSLHVPKRLHSARHDTAMGRRHF